MVEHKDGWTDCVSWDDRPKTLSEGLKILADWFDAVYDDDGVVQADLRTWAADYAALEAELSPLSSATPSYVKGLEGEVARLRKVLEATHFLMLEGKYGSAKIEIERALEAGERCAHQDVFS